MIRRLFSSNIQATFQHRIEQPISYSALFLRVTGTNGAGVAATAREVGRVRLQIRNQAIIEADFDYLQQIVNLYGGSSEFVSTVAGAFQASVLIPRSFPGDGNVERVNKADAALFEVNFTPALFADVLPAGFLVELYAVCEEGGQAYNFTILQQTYPSVGASSFYVDDVSITENVCAAYLSDVVGGNLTLSGSNLLAARTRKGDLVYDGFVSAMQAATVGKYKVEGVVNPLTFPVVELFGLQGSDLSARLEDIFNLEVQTSAVGSATPQILVLGWKANPQRLQESRDEIGRRVERAKIVAAQSNKTRKLAVVDQLAR